MFYTAALSILAISGVDRLYESMHSGCVIAAIVEGNVITCDSDFHMAGESISDSTAVVVRSAPVDAPYIARRMLLVPVENDYDVHSADMKWNVVGSRVVVGGFRRAWYLKHREAHTSARYTVPNLTAVSLPLLSMRHESGIGKHESLIREQVLRYDSVVSSRFPSNVKVILRGLLWHQDDMHMDYFFSLPTHDIAQRLYGKPEIPKVRSGDSLGGIHGRHESVAA